MYPDGGVGGTSIVKFIKEIALFWVVGVICKLVLVVTVVIIVSSVGPCCGTLTVRLTKSIREVLLDGANCNWVFDVIVVVMVSFVGVGTFTLIYPPN